MAWGLGTPVLDPALVFPFLLRFSPAISALDLSQVIYNPLPLGSCIDSEKVKLIAEITCSYKVKLERLC